LLAFTTGVDTGLRRARGRGAEAHLALARSGVRIRQINDLDLDQILELRKVVRWAADLDAFGLLRGMREARWAIAEAKGASDAVVAMVGAVPLGGIGILCHLAVHHDYRKLGLGTVLSSWAVSYLRSLGARVVRLDAAGREPLSLFGF
jgi:GNAT superfamily N-acetyltransferase